MADPNPGIASQVSDLQLKAVADTFLDAFASHSVNLNDFSTSYSDRVAAEGAKIEIPVIASAGQAIADKGDGSDDYMTGNKTTGRVNLQLVQRHVSIPFTPAEVEGSAANYQPFYRALALSAAESIQAEMMQAFIDGLKTGKGSALDIGTSDAFTKETLTRKVWPKVQKAGIPAYCYLDGAYYSSIIPTSTDDFGTGIPAYGFAGIRPLTVPAQFEDIYGFAANQSSLAIATRRPLHLDRMTQAYQTTPILLPEVGFSGTLAIYSDVRSGTQWIGIFWLQAIKALKTDSYVVLHNGASLTSNSFMRFASQSTAVTKAGGASQALGTLSGITAANKSKVTLTAGIGGEWLSALAVSEAGAVTGTVAANNTGAERSTTLFASATDDAGDTYTATTLITQAAK